ncbi:hypothetical protein DM860_003089 [Cuscuta australis]|uniref:MORF/ORRM1/DAG-like MORF domain-containing protein n=1 Tax=Cuscuta australis TaxID=267555 RepID=A0A328D238_9ASTE|nr:hypothetical protein DM860_003089 [Cuscuta australis]
MAFSSLRLRRAISLSPSLLNRHLHHSSFIAPPPIAPPTPVTHPRSSNLNAPFVSQSRLFRASAASFSSRSRFNEQNPNDEGLDPNTILFEGCDYNHWLITMDFPRDPRPSREEMIETYVQTAAKIFGSVEEAKQKIYALSTTTYEGFQVLCSEETADKFKDLPGVVFVLPDSYIDPVNKEYGGDKYTNGVIIERPPPVLYGRQRQNQRGNQSYDPSRTRTHGPPPQSRFQQPPGPPPPQQHYNTPQGCLPPRQPYYGQPQQGPQQTYGQQHSQQGFGHQQRSPPQQNVGPQQGPQQTYGQQHSQQGFGHQQSSPPQQNVGPQQGPQQTYGQQHSQQGFGHQQSFPPQQNVGPQQGHASPQSPPSQQGYGFQQSRGPPGNQMGPPPVYNSPGGFNSYQGGPPHPQGAFVGENKNYGHTQGDHFVQEPTRSQWHGTTAPSFGGENKNYGHIQGERFGQEPSGSQGHGLTAPSFVGENKNYGLTQGERFGQEPARSQWQNHPSEKNQIFSQPEPGRN